MLRKVLIAVALVAWSFVTGVGAAALYERHYGGTTVKHKNPVKWMRSRDLPKYAWTCLYDEFPRWNCAWV
jgi:hypothetical protein